MDGYVYGVNGMGNGMGVRCGVVREKVARRSMVMSRVYGCK